MISLPSLITRAARLNPEGTATAYHGRRFTWTEVHERVAALAGGLASLGLAEGDRIGILSLNSDRYYESLFAIPWAGYCVVPLNTRWALLENDYAIRDSGTRVLLFDDVFSEQARQLLNDVDALTVGIYMGDGQCPAWARPYEELLTSHDRIAVSERGGDDMAGIFYTGGTTGFPKGVMQSHQAIWASAVGALPAFSMNRDDIYLHVAPMFHMADFAGGMAATLCAGSNVILPSFDPEQVLATISTEQVTHLLLVPAMIKMVLNHPHAASSDVSSLKVMLYGASPMPVATLEQCISLWPNVGLVQAYGQTELAPIATTLTAADHRTGGPILRSAGRPTPINDIRIVDQDGNDCPPGMSGEVVVRGPHTMLGYWNKPEETARALRDGWVHTGDVAFIDEQGYVFIVDRIKDMIVTGGENVFTPEVENAVIRHQAVQDVAVIGIPHDEWGEAVHAVVILHPGESVNEEALLDHCRELIAGYKLPKSFTFRAEPLPLSGAGKVLKTELRKPFWEDSDRQVN